MPQWDHSRKKIKDEAITQKGVCFECGHEAITFPWCPPEIIFCSGCSPHQKGFIELPRLKELRAGGVPCWMWGVE